MINSFSTSKHFLFLDISRYYCFFFKGNMRESTETVVFYDMDI